MGSGLTQQQAADRAGCSQALWSRLERAATSAASLETLASAGAAVGTQLAAFIESAPGADLPRDIDHLRRQELVIRLAIRGGWRPMPELAIDQAARRSRSIDVFIERVSRLEAAVIEIVDLLDDVGAALRGLADKVRIVASERSGWRVSGLLIVRATRRNRALVGELRATFDSRFPAPSGDWLEALESHESSMPSLDGLVWSSVRGDRLFARRR